MKIEHELYGIKKIIPDELELRGYLNQCCQYIDKRAFLEDSATIVDYIESKGFDLDDISKIPFEDIKSIMRQLEIFPKYLYFSKNDQFAKYDSPDFEVTIKNSLKDRYKDSFLDLDFTTPAEPSQEEKEDLIQFLPKFYNSLQEVELEHGKVLIAFIIKDLLLDVFSKNGKNLSFDEVDAWRESDYISSCKIALDKKSILLHFLGRMPSWAIFDYNNHSFLYKKSDSNFSQDTSPSNYYSPEEVDIVIKKQSAEKKRISNMPFSVIIGEQEWTTRNLETSQFRNGDLIKEASTNEEWEAAAHSKSPAWCYYENNQEHGVKYGKLYNWFAVSDPRGLAPDSWRIPTVEDWHQLNNYLSSNVNFKLMGGDEWEYDYSISSLFSKDKGPAPIRKMRKSKKFNETGFYALPGGSRGQFGNQFFAIRDSAYWWTSTSVETPREDSKSEKTEDKSIEIDKSDVFDEFNSDNSEVELVEFKKNRNSIKQNNDDYNEEIQSILAELFGGKSKVEELGDEKLENENIDYGQACFTLLYANDEALQIGNFTDKKVGYSVRCIRNK